ncbi:MAG: FAD-binding protein [Acidobacteriaceae bacterium]|jgi:ribulose 1,5-bisphosphate synthetase/thiazole synthase
MPKKNVDRRVFLKGAALAALAPAAQAAPAARKWDKEADVVVIGSGAAGLPASIIARENGASVILVEANRDIGGHAAVCTGNIPLGGGTRAQKEAGIVDSPDILFKDLTDWSVVEPNGAAPYRYNDRDIVRAFADNNVFAYDFLVSHGLTFTLPAPNLGGMEAAGVSAPRAMHAAVMAWPLIQTGRAAAPAVQKTTSGGIGIVRPLEAAARKAGVQILLEHRMTSVIREDNNTGRVVGVTAETKGAKLNIRARKGVILCTGGHSSNVNFRRILDPRLTEEYCGVAGEPYTPQDASGEIAGMAVGASLWGTVNQTGEFGIAVTRAGYIGCQYGYASMSPSWQPTSEYFHLVRATGLRVHDYQDVIEVNQVGVRFYNEMVTRVPTAHPNYVPNSWRNAADMKWNPNNYLPAALGPNGGTGNGGGPIWAIFDAEAVKREDWTVEPPYVDRAAGFFFSGNSIAELAANIAKNRYQKNPMPAQALQDTVARYNSFVDAGKDADFDKPAPMYKIATAPFYAAWATPVLHDSRAGLRINARNQVLDLNGRVIPGLYCAGESAGGFSEHGIARCVVGGLIAGRNAAAEKM